MLTRLAIFVVFLVTGCGKIRLYFAEWPASLAGIEGFSESQKNEVLNAVRDLNQQASKVIISEGLVEYGYPIFIRLVEPKSAAERRIGHATFDELRCEIDISSITFRDERAGLAKSVIWHEIGHCAGLDHDASATELMYFTSFPFTFYSSESIQRFIGALTASMTTLQSYVPY